MAEDTANNTITAAAGTHPSAERAALIERPHLHHGVPHQFDDADQQHEAATLGMWAFLATEVLFFGALLTGYAVYRFKYPQAFAYGSHHLLNEWAGGINTCVLLCSSLAMALAVRAAQLHRRRELIRFLLITIGLGIAFLVVKAFEYRSEYRDNAIPHLNFELEAQDTATRQLSPNVELFMTFYFILTGLHALHMIIGIGIMTALVIAARRGYFDTARGNIVEMSGLYWHFVDIVWIFLFPLLYLIR